MINRPEVTAKLSKLVEKRLNSNHMYWGAEVDFDRNTVKEKRVDYVGFHAFTPNMIVEPASVELGKFEFYEVKSCMADFESGNGLTFYGDHNFLVCTPELAVQLRDEQKFPKDIEAVLCPDKAGYKLYTKFNLAGDPYNGYRRRPASEILWAIVQSHHD